MITGNFGSVVLGKKQLFPYGHNYGTIHEVYRIYYHHAIAKINKILAIDFTLLTFCERKRTENIDYFNDIFLTIFEVIGNKGEKRFR